MSNLKHIWSNRKEKEETGWTRVTSRVELGRRKSGKGSIKLSEEIKV